MKKTLLEKLIPVLKHSNVISLCATLMAVAVTFYGLNCYTLMIDEAYMSLCCKNYENSPLAMMIFYIGDKWISLFGDNFLSLRLLCRVCILVSITIGGVYLWNRTKNLLLTATACLFSALTVNLADTAIYNWDSGAYVVEALGALMLMLYVQKPTIKHAILMGLIWGGMTSFRLPLIAYGGIIIIAVFGVARAVNKTAMAHSLIALVSMIVGWLICIFVMVGSIEAYMLSFKSENIITGHSVNVLEPYINQFVWYFPRQLYFMMPALIAMLVGMIYSFKGKFSLKDLLVFEIILFGIAATFSIAYLEFSTMLLSGIGLPVFLVLVAWPVIAYHTGLESHSNDKFTYKLKLQLWLLFAMMLLMGFGSDTPFQRWSVLFLLPIVLGVLYPAFNIQSKRVIKYIFLMLIPLFCVLIPIKHKFVSSQTVCFNGTPTSVLRDVIITDAEQERYVEIKNVVDSLKNQNRNFTFAGLKSRYIYSGEFEQDGEIKAPLHYYHWEDGNKKMIDQFANKVDAVIYLGDYPADFSYLQDVYNFEIVGKKKHCTVLSK